MAKFNYYNALERLASLSSRAVFIACSAPRSSRDGELASVRLSADRAVCELERVLFSDFMPPLEREDIALCAHALLQIVDASCELSAARGQKSFIFDRKNKEADICIRLSQMIEESISKLRRLKYPSQLPDLVGFRKLLYDARIWHAGVQRKLNSGVYPRSAESYLSNLRMLCRTLGRSFDSIVEIMLSNI